MKSDVPDKGERVLGLCSDDVVPHSVWHMVVWSGTAFIECGTDQPLTISYWMYLPDVPKVS